MNNQRKWLIPEGRKSSVVFFYHELSKIASCNECNVLVPLPNIKRKVKDFFRFKTAEQTLFSLGSCITLLLEYNSNEDVVNFAECENQIPIVTLNLNRIVQKTLKYKDLKVLQEFHLNDNGKKRSFVLQFSKGPEFDKFYQKLKEVVKVLKSCRDCKSVVDKKYYLIGYRQKEEPELIKEITMVKRKTENGSISSSSSDNSVNSVANLSECDNIPPPVLPKPFRVSDPCRVIGLEEALKVPKLQRNKSLSDSTLQKNEFDTEILDSLQKPTPTSDLMKSKYNSGLVFLRTCDDPAWTVKKTIISSDDDDETIQNQTKKFKKSGHSSNNEEGSNISWEIIPSVRMTEIDKDKNRNSDECEFLYSLNIKDIDGNKDRALVYSRDFIKSVKITDIDVDHTVQESHSDDHLCDSNCDWYFNETMKARQEQHQFRQYVELLQIAINDGDRENARQFVDILAAGHVKVAITVDEEEPDVEDIKIKVCIDDNESVGWSLLLSVKLADTVEQLKAKLFYKYKFPIEVQKWIVGNKIARDNDTLEKLRVTNGETVFLYLVSAKPVGLDKQQNLKAVSDIPQISFERYMNMTEQGERYMIPITQDSMNQLNGTHLKQPVKIDIPVIGPVAELPETDSLPTKSYVSVCDDSLTQKTETDDKHEIKTTGSLTDNKQDCSVLTF